MNFWLVCVSRAVGEEPLAAFPTREEALAFAQAKSSCPEWERPYRTPAECRLVEFRGGRPVEAGEVTVVPLRHKPYCPLPVVKDERGGIIASAGSNVTM